MHVYTLDLIGTFAFSMFGAYKALEKSLNIYGIITCAALTALGGGTIRELILRRLPVYFTNHTYLYVTLAGAIVATLLYNHFARIKQYALIIDAVGLAAFAYIGAEKASLAGLGIVGMVFFAVLTAAGGGIVADIITGTKPKSLLDELYILPAIIGGSLYWLLEATRRPISITAYIILVVPFVIRIIWLFRRGELDAIYAIGQGLFGGVNPELTDELEG